MNTTVEDEIAELRRTVAALQQQLDGCRGDRDDADAQRAAVSEILRAINASSRDPSLVFQTVLERAMRLCEASFGGLTTFDGERFHTLAMAGLTPKLAEVFREPFAPSPGSFHYRIVHGESLVHGDHLENPSLQSGQLQTRAAVELGGARTGLVIALRNERGLLGSFWCFRQEIRPFSEKQITLLQDFAAQAVIAMENARLITETREALEQQTATAEVLGVINSSPGHLAPVFDAVLEKATRLCNAVFGNLWTYDGEVARFAAVRGASPEFRAELMRAGPQKPEPGNALMRLVEGETLVHIADITAEGAYRSETRRRFAKGTGARTALWMPLRNTARSLASSPSIARRFDRSPTSR